MKCGWFMFLMLLVSEVTFPQSVHEICRVTESRDINSLKFSTESNESIILGQKWNVGNSNYLVYYSWVKRLLDTYMYIEKLTKATNHQSAWRIPKTSYRITNNHEKKNPQSKLQKIRNILYNVYLVFLWNLETWLYMLFLVLKGTWQNLQAYTRLPGKCLSFTRGIGVNIFYQDNWTKMVTDLKNFCVGAWTTRHLTNHHTNHYTS